MLAKMAYIPWEFCTLWEQPLRRQGGYLRAFQTLRNLWLHVSKLKITKACPSGLHFTINFVSNNQMADSMSYRVPCTNFQFLLVLLCTITLLVLSVSVLLEVLLHLLHTHTKKSCSATCTSAFLTWSAYVGRCILLQSLSLTTQIS